MPNTRRIAIDLQPLQSYSSRRRGIGRYVLELVSAVVENHSESIHSLLVSPDRSIPPEIERFIDTGLVRPHSQDAPLVDGLPPEIYFITSPYEMSIDLYEVWPRWARERSVKSVAVLYDLIPSLFPEQYLHNPVWLFSHWSRQKMVEQMDLLLGISEHTTNDGMEHLGFTEKNIKNIGTGISGHFTLPASKSETLTKAVKLVDGLRGNFIMYTGGFDYRKNIDGLLKALSILKNSGDLSGKGLQLVIVCHLLDNERAALTKRARSLGVLDDILLTGFVPDDVLSLLYQSADLFVFPSIYEGFGLPIAEAVLSGTLSITSNTSSMVELVTDPDLLFNPHDPGEIASTIGAALNSEERDLLWENQYTHIKENFRWGDVASRAVSAMGELEVNTVRNPIRRRGRIAFITPLPPDMSNIASYSLNLIKALSTYVDVDVVAENRNVSPDDLPDNVELISWGGLLARDEILEYDDVIYVMGDTKNHERAFKILDARHGSVLAHGARFTGFLEWYLKNVGEDKERFTYLLGEEHRGLDESVFDDELSEGEAEADGLWMTGPVIDMADRLLATNTLTERVATIQRPDRSGEIINIGFGYQPTVLVERSKDVVLVATFGYQNDERATTLIVDAFSILASENPDLRLAVVGEIDELYEPALRESIVRSGVADKIVTAPCADQDEYDEWLKRADVAIELHRSTNGETMAGVGDTLRYGVPTIVSPNVHLARFSPDVVETLRHELTVSAIADATRELITDAPRRSELTLNATRHINDHSFDEAARDLLRAVGVHTSDTKGV